MKTNRRNGNGFERSRDLFPQEKIFVVWLVDRCAQWQVDSQQRPDDVLFCFVLLKTMSSLVFHSSWSIDSIRKEYRRKIFLCRHSHFSFDSVDWISFLVRSKISRRTKAKKFELFDQHVKDEHDLSERRDDALSAIPAARSCLFLHFGARWTWHRPVPRRKHTDELARSVELTGAFHFPLKLNPTVNAFQRKFVNEVRRCEEMERKLRENFRSFYDLRARQAVLSFRFSRRWNKERRTGHIRPRR